MNRLYLPINIRYIHGYSARLLIFDKNSIFSTPEDNFTVIFPENKCKVIFWCGQNRIFYRIFFPEDLQKYLQFLQNFYEIPILAKRTNYLHIQDKVLLNLEISLKSA